MLESIITSRGRTTVPRAVRKALSLRAGDRIRYTIEEGFVCIQPSRPIRRLRGIVKHEGPAVALEEMDRAIAEGACDPLFRGERVASERSTMENHGQSG